MSAGTVVFVPGPPCGRCGQPTPCATSCATRYAATAHVTFGDAEGFISVTGPRVRITLGRIDTTVTAAEAEAFAHLILAEAAQARALAEPRERNEDDCGADFDARECAS